MTKNSAPIGPDGGFSSAGLVERLGGPQPASPVVEGARAYRELYMTIVAVLIVMVAAIAYQFTRANGSRPDKAEAPAAAPPPPPVPARAGTAPLNRTVPGPSMTSSDPAGSSSAGSTEGRRRSTTSTPMLTIVSTPSGAMVNIDGLVYGETPLIKPGPRDKAALSITLNLEGYRKYSRIVTRNEAGHFSLNVRLEPL